MAKTLEACALAATLAGATASLTGLVSDWTVQFAHLHIAEPMITSIEIGDQALEIRDLKRPLIELSKAGCDCEMGQAQGVLASFF